MPPQPSEPDEPSPWALICNRCDAKRVVEPFRPLVIAASAACLDALPGVVDIRLQGSVARGEAVVGWSDLDVTILLDHPPGDGARTRLREHEADLQRRYPIVSRVELDALAVPALSPFQRFALSSDSISVYGTDTLTRRTQWMKRTALARLVTPDAAATAADYRALVAEASASEDAAAVRWWSRLAGKDLLKCLRGLVLLRGGAYTASISAIPRQVDASAPEWTALARRLDRLYREPDADPTVVLGVLDEAEATLLPAVSAISDSGIRSGSGAKRAARPGLTNSSARQSM